jgi:hypothetical protein
MFEGFINCLLSSDELEHIRLRLLFKRLDDFITAEIKMERARGEMSR